MDNQNLSQQQQTIKSNRNLSIKEFFTNRLMRTRSFEGGPDSPKDETTNWFNEIKARMTKKSLATNSSKQASNFGITVEDINEVLINDACEAAVAKSAAPGAFKSKLNQSVNKDENVAQVVKDSLCDNYADVNDDLCESVPVIEHCQQSSKESALKTRFAELRSRRLQRISSVESPDFDTASINTIFNRRDSRYEKTFRRPHRILLSKILGSIKWIISTLLPFNYNLPWKLMSIISFTFVIIVIGLTSKTNPDIMAFTFFNGFICGLLIATFCFTILMLSLLVQFIPTSEDSALSLKTKSAENTRSSELDSSMSRDRLRTPNLSFINEGVNRESVVFGPAEKKQPEDFTLFEVLESGIRRPANETDPANNLLDDDNYKGWMIEFIGDYELRNKSEIKLKLIFARIENRILHLCKPKNSHDAESATFPVFVQQRTYDLNNVKKFSANLLLPKAVRNRQKWVWSKKYPIRLEFLNDSNNNEQPSKLSIADVAPKQIQLTLFAKSCREKEEWFRRFKRIIETNRLAQAPSTLIKKRNSLQSNISSGNDDAPPSSIKSFNCRSPSPASKQEGVQTSRSSHVLNDQRQAPDDEQSRLSFPETNLTRTKSCELLHAEQSSDQSDDEDEGTRYESGFADDSTLTRETAELFSQAVEYSNFMESRPNLNYLDYITRVIDSSQDATPTCDWFNALTGRIFFDVFSHNYWSVWFRRKIQRKLYRIRLPYFMETLTLTKIDLGENAPQFLNVVSHNFDSFGLSIDFDMVYSGGLTLTFETKLNLLKIKADNSSTSSATSHTNTATTTPSGSGGTTTTTSASNQTIATGTASSSLASSSANSCDQNNTQSSSQLPLEYSLTTKTDSSSSSQNESNQHSLGNPIREGNKAPLSSSASTRTSGESSDSDESDSDSSSDSSVEGANLDEISDWEDYGAEKTRQSIVRFVDKIASSRYFQHATENRYIKKKLQDISNCPLVLIVKIQSLNGVLTLNVPPPQTDRVWYGFKPNPELILKALPKMGDREVNLSHVTDWIERKLAEEFRKILVIPNMEDIVLPVLKSDHLVYVTTTK